MVTLLALQQQWQNLEANFQIYCQYMSSQNVTRYPYGTGEDVCSQFDVIIKFVLYLSVFAYSNSEESKWMTARIRFISMLYGGGTESLNCCWLPTPMTLASGGVRCYRLWSTRQLLRPSGQQCSHSGGVCPQIRG